MAVPVLKYTTGPSTLGDDPHNPGLISGTLKYNGCTFSPLFETKVSGKCVRDNADRIVKCVEFDILVDGYVTLPDGEFTIDPTMRTLYRLLTEQSGQLIYKGRGLDLAVWGQRNRPGWLADVAWGPKPELLEFQPLGAGRSAKVVWRVTTSVTQLNALNIGRSLNLLQLNYETSLTYGEDGYSSFSIKGTMEIPISRSVSMDVTFGYTVDDVRQLLERTILKGIDLGRYHITGRHFDISRDKRTMEWSFDAEEKPFMDLPEFCTVARGSFVTRPAQTGPGLVNWVCTLQATYTVAANQMRLWAFLAFYGLLRLRMQQTLLTPSPTGRDDNQPQKTVDGKQKIISRKPWLIDFSVSEGLYKDSKTVTFSASWRLICSFSQVILASGTWRKLPEGDGGDASDRRERHNLWAQSMRISRNPTKNAPSTNIMGPYSWLSNVLDPALDVIVDMGSEGV